MALIIKTRFSFLCRFFSFGILFFLFLHGCSARAQKFTPSPAKTKKSSSDLASSASIRSATTRPYKVMGKWYHPLASAQGFRQRGLASWYGKDFHGKKTSNGEVYNMNEISAAHKTLPLGTYVRVRNIKNNKELDLRINDRGPFVAGRVIDLSKAAAKKLGVYGPGTAPVEVIALGVAAEPAKQNSLPRSYIPVNYYEGKFTIQVGAFSNLDNAKKFRQQLYQLYKYVNITTYYTHRGGKRLYRVTVGRCSSLQLAGQYESYVKKNGFKDAFMVAE
ncbi:septal ring lytic transglycosylase RlpA family protein [Desulfonema magnum]|nr:septal ring lytic transglycosylase RlpA family protein [Desulfonema magnum]